MNKLKLWTENHKLLAEILRFCIVGGIATIVDFFCMGCVLYAFEPHGYPHFYNVFFGSNFDPSQSATIVGTGVGFTVGLLVNYLLSIFFVFEEKGKSKTVTGFIVFTLFSIGGLLIHLLGMWLGYSVLKINEWIVKIFLTIVVLIYNYLTRKFFIFRKAKGVENE